MTNILPCKDYPWLKKTYFSDHSHRLRLRKGEVLIRQSEFNDRLFLILRGAFAGYVKSPENSDYELFKAKKDMFVGVYSFFSKTFVSSATVIATEESEVAYLTLDQEIHPSEKGQSLFEQFMPVVVTNLAHRQQNEQRIAFEKEKALKKLIQTEKLASLGQMAAGIAHELNNAITVLERNSQWLCDSFSAVLEARDDEGFEYYQSGLNQGRRISSREVRKRIKTLVKRFSISTDHAREIAEAGIPDTDVKGRMKDSDWVHHVAHYHWEIGATFHDMLIAAHLGSHVVKSVRALAMKKSTRDAELDLNETIHEALSLLSSPLRKVNVKLALSALPVIQANPGELVQVWANIIKNAIESMSGGCIPNQQLTIKSQHSQRFISVTIQDNGPGITETDHSKIFQPDFTTKEKGLEFGLGLGLTIVSRIVNSYGGEIFVKSKSGETIFTIQIPV